MSEAAPADEEARPADEPPAPSGDGHWLLVVLEVLLAAAGAWMIVACIASLPILQDHVVLDPGDDDLATGFRTTRDELLESMPSWQPDGLGRELCDGWTAPTEAVLAPAAQTGGAPDDTTEPPPTAPPADGTEPAPGVPSAEVDCAVVAREVHRVEDELMDHWRGQHQAASSALRFGTTSAIQRLRSGLAIPQRPDDQRRYAAEVQQRHLAHGHQVLTRLQGCAEQLTRVRARLKRDAMARDDGRFLRAQLERLRGPTYHGDAWCSGPGKYLATPYPENTYARRRLAAADSMTLRLYATRSPDLVLLVGMIGCGLMGAGVSSFIRRRRERDDEPRLRVATTSDLVSVVVGGFTAAIVVFLGVESGLAVLTEGDVEVKPHGMLFLCLLGSAFSDVTWQWARDRLHQMLPSNGTAPENGSPPTARAAGTGVAKDEGGEADTSASPAAGTPKPRDTHATGPDEPPGAGAEPEKPPDGAGEA
ncbi:MAG TPA: hypothetical protein RMH99_16615 [Sandaracinaceae bacterium LLY-WYZ-13_1]|nr:hypothetical protein [Sandaracinaceae bacterium LLY-WYZ-13_1]